MKTDTKYSHIHVCPETREEMSNNEVNNSSGVCPYCGDISEYSFTHSDKIAVRYVRPSLFERVFKGKKIEMIRKIDEDAIMKKLKR